MKKREIKSRKEKRNFFTVAKLHDSSQILVTNNLGQNIFEQVKKWELYANIRELLESPPPLTML